MGSACRALAPASSEQVFRASILAAVALGCPAAWGGWACPRGHPSQVTHGPLRPCSLPGLEYGGVRGRRATIHNGEEVSVSRCTASVCMYLYTYVEK